VVWTRAIAAGVLACVGVACIGGCGLFELKGGPSERRDKAARAGWPFAPVAMRVSPFTSIRPGDGDGGGERELDLKIELRDQVGDLTKGVGRFRIELYEGAGEGEARERSPLFIWRASIESIEDNRVHYNSTLRTYDFRLALRGGVDPSEPARVFVQYTPRRGDRLVDERTIEGR